MLLASPALACERGVLIGHVTYAQDGDTREFGDMTVRLQGLAAPERDEPSGKAARDAMMELVHGRVLCCELDGTRTYDRCVGICYLEGAEHGRSTGERGAGARLPAVLRWPIRCDRGVSLWGTALPSARATGLPESSKRESR